MMIEKNASWFNIFDKLLFCNRRFLSFYFFSTLMLQSYFLFRFTFFSSKEKKNIIIFFRQMTKKIMSLFTYAWCLIKNNYHFLLVRGCILYEIDLYVKGPSELNFCIRIYDNIHSG